MRDPERIKRIGDKLIQLWQKHPDWRLGQLVSNLCGGMSGGSKGDIFFPEDSDWEKWIDDSIGFPYEGRSVFTEKNEWLESTQKCRRFGHPGCTDVVHNQVPARSETSGVVESSERSAKLSRGSSPKAELRVDTKRKRK